MELFAFNYIELSLLASLTLFFLIQFTYYISIYNRIHQRNKAVLKDKISFQTDLPPISVIICAKNESVNLQRYLPDILEQDYPNFEVIVINDSSTDESEDILTLLEEKYPHLYHTFTPETVRYVSRKKLALTLGIKASKYDWLVFTDANCHPAGPEWLKFMARNFTSKTDIVLGYSGYEHSKKWFSRKVSFDNLFTSVRYLGMALIHRPYMGVGRNLAYRKELFFKSKGYSSHLNLQRGDDDLFINEVATRTNTRVETAKEAIIHMQVPEYKKNWKEEKISYAATSRFFKGAQRYILGFETFSRIIFYGLFIALLVISVPGRQWVLLGTGVVIYLLRYLLQLIILNKAAKDLDTQRYYLTLPLFDILQPLWSLKFKAYRLFRGKGDFMRR